VTLELAFAETATGTTWNSPAAGLWVAFDEGTYIGMVERIDGRYVASGVTGRDVGRFDELSDAQIALEGDLESADNPRDLIVMKAIIGAAGLTGLVLACSLFLR
jgi:hypothetical protein